MSIELGVNIDHVATLRQARGGARPDPVHAALLAEECGADAITLHVREDRRHIQDEDAMHIRQLMRTRMNFECAMVDEMLTVVERVKPHDVCLVPERRMEVTTEGGLDVLRQQQRVQTVVSRLSSQGIRVSLFIDPDLDQIRAAHASGAPVIELHTGCYARYVEMAQSDPVHEPALAKEKARLRDAVRCGADLGLRVNAGHGLDYRNVDWVAAQPEIAELNIGHAIVAHAVFVGWVHAVREMKDRMLRARAGT